MNYHRFSDKYESTFGSIIPLNIDENTIVDSILIEYESQMLTSNAPHISLYFNDIKQIISFDNTYCLINNKIHIPITETYICQYDKNRYKIQSYDMDLKILHDENPGQYTVILYKKRYFSNEQIIKKRSLNIARPTLLSNNIQLGKIFDELTFVNSVKITSKHDPMTGPYSSFKSIVVKYFHENQEYCLYLNPMTYYTFKETSYVFDTGSIFVDKNHCMTLDLVYKDENTIISYGVRLD